ncbi:exosome nuclease subunit [Tilletia horrida]|nr:exosome nuclease subunit [Tilletia horrida]
MASSSRQKLEDDDSSSTKAGDNALNYLHSVQGSLVPLTRTASQLPQASDLNFHRSLNPSLAAKLDSHSQSILDLINNLTSFLDPSTSAATQLSKQNLNTDLNNNVPRAIGDLIDSLLEKADIGIDEYTGKRDPAPIQSSFTLVANRRANDKGKARQIVGAADTASAGASAAGLASSPAAHHHVRLPPLPQHIINAHMKKPQRLFSTKPDNRSTTPWTRDLKYGKPNATVHPLERSGPNRSGGPDPKQVWKNPKTRQGMWCSEGDAEDNYYYHEILQARVPTHALEPRTPVRTQPLDPEKPDAPTDAGPFTWVDSAQGIHALVAHLNEDRVQEIAIDLEHTSFRTYQGLACLMQISTRWGDWIVDTLTDAVRENAELLNQAFTDPNKIKVLHGADHDILWMQRDLGLYIVGLFDTYQAAVVLDYAQKGLAYLLERFCAFHADKRYQLADWRIRPLPKEMLYYAREDTHDLLYIYDCIRSELRNKALATSTSDQSAAQLSGKSSEANGTTGYPDSAAAIVTVFQRSKSTAARTYAKDVWDESGLSREGWRSLLTRYLEKNSTTNPRRQTWLVRALHKWRDEVARKEDESPKYVLNSTNLLGLASKAPKTPIDVMNVIKTGPKELKARLGELTKVMQTEIDAFEKYVRDEAEALKLAAMGVTVAATSNAKEGGEESNKDDDDSDEEEGEETGETVSRDEDVDMFALDTTAAGTSSSRDAPNSALVIEDVRTKMTSSPTVAAASLWSGVRPDSGSTSAGMDMDGPAPQKKKSLFSLPAGLQGGVNLFGNKAKQNDAEPNGRISTGSGSNLPRPTSTLFDAIIGDAAHVSRVPTSSGSSSNSKASVIRAGLAAAMGGLLGSGNKATPSGVQTASSGHQSGDYEDVATAPTAFRAGATDRMALSSSGPAPAPAIKMSSGRTLSSITQKLLSRGFHNNNPSTTNSSSTMPSLSEALAKANLEAANGRSADDDEDEDEPDGGEYGSVIRLKRAKKQQQKKKRGLEEAEVEGGEGESAPLSTLRRSKKARTDVPSSSSTSTTAGPTGFLKPFDLTKDSSILDLPAPASSSSSSSLKKGNKDRKSGGGGGGGGANFGPAPRKRNELGSGNRSATFRS